MSDHRRHHYVPRFYLEMFASRPGAVGVYAIERRKLIPHAPIKRQAYRNYFYGTDGRAEKILGDVESNAGPVLAAMRKDRRTPEPGSPGHDALLLFLAFQHCRTVRAEAQHNEGAEKTMRAYLRKQAELEGNQRVLDALDRVRLRPPNPIAESLRAAAIGASLLVDLHMLLIVNSTDVPFIASDAPVVVHNRLYEGRSVGSPAGYGSVGLQIVLPLGPDLMLLCFDPRTYHAHGAENGVVHLKDGAAAQRLNDLQWESAEALIFASTGTSAAALDAAATRWEPLRGGDRMVFRQEIVEESETRVHVRQGIGEKPSCVVLDLPVLTEAVPPPAALGPLEAAPLRNPARMDFVMGVHEILKDVAEVYHAT